MKFFFLIDKDCNQNSFSFIFSILINKKYIKENIVIDSKLPNENYDIIFLDSKFFIKEFNKDNLKYIQDCIIKLKSKCKKLVYVDNEASIFINKNVIEMFDYYLKGRIPKNLNLYKEKLYGLREFTNFYFKKFKINDVNIRYSDNLEERNIKKIILSWNNGICDYSFWSKINRNIFKFSNLIIRNFKYKNYKKNNNLSMRFYQNYNRQTINYQRKELIKLVANTKLTHRVNRFRYFLELKNSKVSISPFGWGEICYRDFESFYYKCALVKPDMDHLNTWPNYYIKNKTYLSLNWDFSNFNNIMNYTQDDLYKEKIKYISEEGQKNYFKYLYPGEDSFFLLHFKKILNKVLY